MQETLISTHDLISTQTLKGCTRKNLKRLKCILHQDSASMYKNTAAKYLNKYSGNYLQWQEMIFKYSKVLKGHASIPMQKTLLET